MCVESLMYLTFAVFFLNLCTKFSYDFGENDNFFTQTYPVIMCALQNPRSLRLRSVQPIVFVSHPAGSAQPSTNG